MSKSLDSATNAGDGALVAARCHLVSCRLVSDLTNATSVLLYDNATAASGTVIAQLVVPAIANGLPVDIQYFGDSGVVCENGIYADHAANPGSVYVYYRLG